MAEYIVWILIALGTQGANQQVNEDVFKTEAACNVLKLAAERVRTLKCVQITIYR